MDFEKAASYWEEKDKTSAKMDRETLLREAEAFLTAHNTCALATGAGRFVRCTPIEYTSMNTPCRVMLLASARARWYCR